MGALLPEIRSDFQMSLSMAAFLPFSFFAAYGVMSIPVGMVLEKSDEKTVMIIAFLASLIGALTFSAFPGFKTAIFSLFLIGAGMAALQVAINPLLRTAGGEENFAFNSVIAQLVFGAASFLSPLTYTYLVNELESGNANPNFLINTLKHLVPEDYSWVSLYWIFALISLVTAVILFFVKFPKVERKEDEVAGAWKTHVELFKNKTVIMFFIGIFAYVGTEQGIANWISQFLQSYHGLSPRVEGAESVSLFWGMLTIGCLLGLVLLKLWDARKVLKFFTVLAIASLMLALLGSKELALIAFPLTGFFISVMWSVIFSLALNSMDKHHGSFSGILVTGIVGGAVVPLIIGSMADVIGLKYAMFFILIPLGYIFVLGYLAKPIILNKTLSVKEIKSIIFSKIKKAA